LYLNYNIVQFRKRISKREHIKRCANSIIVCNGNGRVSTNVNIFNRKMWNITVNQLYLYIYYIIIIWMWKTLRQNDIKISSRTGYRKYTCRIGTMMTMRIFRQKKNIYIFIFSKMFIAVNNSARKKNYKFSWNRIDSMVVCKKAFK